MIQDEPSKARVNDAQLLRAIIDYLPLPIFLKDQDSRFVLSNKQHGQLLQKTEAELLGNDTSLVT